MRNFEAMEQVSNGMCEHEAVSLLWMATSHYNLKKLKVAR